MVHSFRLSGRRHYGTGSSWQRPWTNGQVERRKRTITEAPVKRFHTGYHEQLRAPLADFVAADKFGRRLKTLKGLTPSEFICRNWTKEPERFTLNPLHQMPGLNIDESGITTTMTRTHARAPRGERASAAAPFGSWQRLTLLGARSTEGVVAEHRGCDLHAG